jgi:hypothetical protein
MKNLTFSISALVIALTPVLCSAQVFTGSAKDKSSVIYHGATLGISITDPSIGFSLNNFSNEKYKNKKKKVVWALNGTAASNSGIANFFNGGDISSGVNANAIVGYSWTCGKSNKLTNLQDKAEVSYNDLLDSYKKHTNEIQTFLSGKVTLMHNTAEANLLTYLPKEKNAEKRKKLSDALNKFIDGFSINHIQEDIKTMTDSYPDDATFLKETAEKIVSIGIGAYADVQEMGRKTDQLFTQIRELRGYWQNRFTVYGAGGYTTNGFKLFETPDTTNFSKSFQNKLFRGYSTRLGGNIQFGSRWLIGANFGYEMTDNFSTLSSKDYTITTIQSNSSGQQLKTEKKITAYSGDYFDELKTYPLNADAILFVHVSDTAVAGLNLYLRQTYSESKKKLPETTNIGFGVYFFSNTASKFLGGIYVEAPDINNNIAKNVPDANLRPLNKRLTFGLVAKFTFSSIFSYGD